MMSTILFDVKNVRKVQSNINQFESLNIAHRSAPNDVSKRENKKLIGEVDAVNDEEPPLLTPITTTATQKQSPLPAVTSQKSNQSLSPASHRRHDSAVFLEQKYLTETSVHSLSEDAKEILKSQPSVQDIEAVLVYLQYGIDGQHDFNVKRTEPQTSQLVRVLATTTIPDVWSNIDSDSTISDKARSHLLEVMFSVTGLEAILEQIRHLTHPSNSLKNSERLQSYLSFLGRLLSPSTSILRFLQDEAHLYTKEIHRRLHWQSVVTLLAGSKVLNTMAAVPNIVAETNRALIVPDWLTDGTLYSRWIARNIVKASISLHTSDHRSWAGLALIFKRSLSLGYKVQLVSEVYTSLLLGQSALWTPLKQLMTNMPIYDQKQVLDSILSDVSHQRMSGFGHIAANSKDLPCIRAIGAAATLISGLIHQSEDLTDYTIEWISGPNGSGGKTAGCRRAMIAALSQSQSILQRVLERSMTRFSDSTYIRNTELSQQQHLAQTILIVTGRLHRMDPESLQQTPFPSLSMKLVSDRLASSVPSVRLLGMVVGTALSQCVDGPDKSLKFDVEDMSSDYVQNLLDLLNTDDQLGDLEDLKLNQSKVPKQYQPPVRQQSTAQLTTKEPGNISKIIAIEELSSSSDDEDDLVPMTKPLHDPEDSDEDVTLINRNKPRPPVYIRDLIKKLNSPNDNLDVIALAIKTAAPLIRRKAGFGTELKDSIYELTSTLVNLQDGLSEPEHLQQRVEALQACFVAEPSLIGSYLSNIYFEGDLSLSQRSTILTVLGIGSRTIAGLQGGTQLHDVDGFPSQKLPPDLQPLPVTATRRSSTNESYNPVTILAANATRETIGPLAEAAASSQGGPDILKVGQITRTSASLSIKAKRDGDVKNRQKIVPKNLYNILAHEVFIPLTSSMTAVLLFVRSKASTRTNTLLLHPSNLSLHLQTLTLLLHTLGSTGLGLTQIQMSVTSEILLMMLAIQSVTQLALDPVVLPAFLGLLLALIDITTEVGVTAQEILLGNEFGPRVAECIRWVDQLENMPGTPSPSTESGKGVGGMAWTVLAAGIQVRWYEIGKHFQSKMMGFQLE